MSKNVFISHSSVDADKAVKLCDYLEKNGVECFIAPRDIKVGNEYAEELINGIEESKVMVLLLSGNSNNSPHVLREVERAVSKSIPVLVYKIEDVELSKSMEYFLMTRQWICDDESGAFANILDAVNRDLSNKNFNNKNNIELSEKNHIKNKKNIGNKNIIITLLAIIIVVISVSLIMFLLDGIKGDNEKKADTKENVQETVSNNVLTDNNKETNKEIDKKEDYESSSSDKADYSNLKLGDKITFGTYANEKIEWRVLRLSEDKKEAVLVSEYILCMKGFDAAESGMFSSTDGKNYVTGDKKIFDENFEYQILGRGNSNWSTSNIRTWLNSEKNVVEYKDQPPKKTAMSDVKNGYELEAGFLSQFTKEELEAIKTVKNKSVSNVLSEKEFVETSDKVYLLSAEETKWFDEADLQIVTKPTQNAIENDKSNIYNVNLDAYGTENHYWWLRDSHPDYSSKVYIVYNGYSGYGDKTILEENAAVDCYGIRPAITVKIELL